MNVIFVFNSVTAAKRVEKTIAKYGVLSKVIHTPKGLGRGGCSHSVRFDERNVDIVKKVILASEIDILGAYREIYYNGTCSYRQLTL